jgi:hypothetical protein
MVGAGAVWKGSAVVERAVVTGWLAASILAANSAQASAGSAIPFPGNNIPRRIAEWGASILDAVRAAARTPLRRSEPKRRYYHPQRESYIEDAAMSREMYRL